jgi:L-asparagine transporter-like permease
MVDREDVGIIIRITGIVLSIISALMLAIRPFEYVTNMLTVYGLLLTASVLVITGQLLSLSKEKGGSEKAIQKRLDSLYDIITVAILILLFTILYIIPFVREHTVWL